MWVDYTESACLPEVGAYMFLIKVDGGRYQIRWRPGCGTNWEPHLFGDLDGAAALGLVRVLACVSENQRVKVERVTDASVYPDALEALGYPALADGLLNRAVISYGVLQNL